ncbi:hypothetical protein JXJ21_23980 [candidate division KSB1 bacterium]|nr:hypothetical protein [candidate division KSB1 bacterium]
MPAIQQFRLKAVLIFAFYIILANPLYPQRNVQPLCIEISREHPLIIMMAPHHGELTPEENGEYIADAWRQHYPDELKPYTVVQIEERVLDYEKRMELFRRRLNVLAQNEIPIALQIADPDDQYTMPLDLVEQLLIEYPIIKGLNLVEMRIEHYSTFGGELKYKVPAETAHLIDAIKLAAKYGRFTSIQLQKLRWPHLLADDLQKPLLDTMREFHEYVFPQNEGIEPYFITRQAAVLGLWLSDVVDHFGMEPQSWFWAGCRFREPGIFGPNYDGTNGVPPRFYRPMILINAMTGGTVYAFEPSWDLWNEPNGHIGREVIYPTMLEIIRNRLIPTKEQVLEKTRVAYQMNYCKTLGEFHVNINDIDPVAGNGLLSRAAYGLFWRGQNYEVIPDNSRYFFIPLLPWDAPNQIMRRFESVMRAGEFTSVAAYQAYMNQFYSPQNSGDAFAATINGATYIMQTCENLYRQQAFRIQVPQWVEKPTVQISEGKVRFTWEDVPGAKAYEFCVLENPAEEFYEFQFKSLATLKGSAYEIALPDSASVVCGIRAIGSKTVELDGNVNYLDSHIFFEEKSPLRNVVRISADRRMTHHDLLDLTNDPRPKQQVIYPTFPNVPAKYMKQAREIIAAYDSLVKKYEQSDWQGVANFYDPAYRDPNGYSREYVGRALKWYFHRNQHPFVNMQVRDWDFSEFMKNETVKLKLWTLWWIIAVDDLPWGDHGLIRIPRHNGEETWFTWKKDVLGHWKIMSTNPALPNFGEILWNARGFETPKKLVPSID